MAGTGRADRLGAELPGLIALDQRDSSGVGADRE
jgi:hypothetical protein